MSDPARSAELPGPAPGNLEAERALLGAALLDADALAEVLGRLQTEWFTSERNRVIHATLTELAARDHEVDMLTLQAELERRGRLRDAGGLEYLALLLEEGSTRTLLPQYIEIVREAAFKRCLAAQGRELVWSALDGGDPADLLRRLDDLREQLGTLVSGIPEGPFAQGLGEFMAEPFGPIEPLIEGLVSAEGGGWRAGEEKLGKTLYCLHEGLGLALGHPVLGRFPVPRRRRVLFVEEEDSPRRAQARVRAQVRGMGYEPDDPSVLADLDRWFRIVCWRGFSFDDPAMLRRLETEVAGFRPAVVYFDVLRKMTVKDLNKADQAGVILAALDGLRRKHDVIPVVLHHFRKSQGLRVGRGSQEIGGSYVLGAWGENSLFFEPVGRTAGIVRVDVQSKDLPAIEPFRLVIEAEGSWHAPTVIRLRTEAFSETTIGAENREKVFQALKTLERTSADQGRAGVTVDAIVAALKLSEKSVRRHLSDLRKEKLALEAGVFHKPHAKGKGAKKIPLWLPAEPSDPESAQAEAPLGSGRDQGESTPRQVLPEDPALPEGGSAGVRDIPSEALPVRRKGRKPPRRGGTPAFLLPEPAPEKNAEPDREVVIL